MRLVQCLYYTSLLDGFPRKHDKKAWALVKSPSQHWRQISKWRQWHSSRSFFRGIEELPKKDYTLYWQWIMKCQKRCFTEEFSFETEVAQAAALSAILLSKKQRQERGLDELRINNWWFQGYRNWDDAAFRNGWWFLFLSIHTRSFLDFLGLTEPSFDLSASLNW